MALKTAVLLLSLALAVHATDFDGGDALHSKLNNDINSVCNELLGVPCKNTSPPPSPPPSNPNYPPPAQPPYTPPRPSPYQPPATPPSSPPVKPPTQPPTVPPTVPPTYPPTLPPGAPNPSVPGSNTPVGDGRSTARVSLLLPDGYELTPAQVQILIDILQEVIGGNGVISISSSESGRKLLVKEEFVTFTIDGVKDCTVLIDVIIQFIESGAFVKAANGKYIPLLGAGGVSILCTGRNAGTDSATTPPAEVQNQPPPPAPVNVPAPGPEEK